MHSQSLGQMFRQRAGAVGTSTLFLVPRAGSFEPITWAQARAEIDRIALGLSALGLCAQDRVALLSENRHEWILCDLAVLSLGAADVPIYPTSSGSDIAHILGNSGARFVIVSSRELHDRIAPIVKELGSIEKVVLIDSHLELENDRTLTLARVKELGAKQDPAILTRALEAVHEDDLATIIYTSGTTGPPKGVMLTHANFLSNCMAMTQHIDIGPGDRSLSFLPLSHCFERTAGHYAFLWRGAQIAYAENMNSVAQDMIKAKPTVVLGVPRLYEKVRTRVLQKVHDGPYLRRFLFGWAMSMGRRVFFLRERKKPIPWHLRLRHALARATVFAPVRRAFGGRLRFFVSGGAPLAPEVVEFFEAMGIVLLEGYGLTETTPVVSCNQPEFRKLGSVGRALPGVEVRIGETGEILIRGKNVMRGYFKLPSETARVIDADHFFHTGDVGHVDADGFLFITDRLKDLIITAGGKNVSPQNIENRIKLHPLIEQACLIGDRRPFLTALIVPNRDGLAATAKRLALDTTEVAALLRRPEVARLYQEAIQSVNDDLASFERIKRFALLGEPFSQENGELTPTLKVKRKVVEDHHREIIDNMYRADLGSLTERPGESNALLILSGMRETP
ncbi:MAG: long-chain fatty acid--CoA ligase [Planctomycetota bacterium]